MNEWIEKSIKLANSKGYLDSLLEIYPITPNNERHLPDGAEVENFIKVGNLTSPL